MPLIDWPALAIGLIVLFYWGRVVKLVLKTRRLTGKAANFFPPEPLGRVLRIVWYPNVAAWVAVPLVVALMRHPPGFLTLWYLAWPVRWLAVVGACVALYLTLICWRKMGRDWRMGIDPGEQNTLIVSGPYAFVRHPIYALQQLLVVVSLLAVPNPGMAVVAVIQIVFLNWEALREERHMAGVHPEKYPRYLRQVGRFIPRGRYREA